MNNITLIGMPGCGKSTLGVILAKALAYDFIDTDLMLQRSEGAPLHEILDRVGPQTFACLEDRLLCSLEVNRTVIATGGSAVYCQQGMARLKAISKVIYLHISFEEMQKRLADYSARGIVFQDHMDLHGLYCQRLPLYRKYADAELCYTGKTAERAVEQRVQLSLV